MAAARIELVHMSSPVCQWSWGFEPVVNRIEALYGKQVKVFVGQALPYTDREEWLKDYGMTDAEAVAWAHDDIARLSRLPMFLPKSWHDMPASTLPAGIAVKAAGIAHGPRAERRLSRGLMNAFFVEGRDTSDDKVIASVVEDLGLDNAKMMAVAQTDAPGNALGDDGERGGHGANFYSLLVRDGLEESGTKVVLEHAYDAARAERAIDHMAGKKLKKTPPKLGSELIEYVAEHGFVSLEEAQSFFAVDRAKAKAALDKATKQGDLAASKHAKVGGATFWQATK